MKRNVRHSPAQAPRVAALISLAATLILTASGLEGATTVNAKSASQSDVAAAIASAADGDTVMIPGGTATWTHTLPIRKAITLQGSGVGVTIIKDSVQKGRLIDWTLAAGYPSRLTGIEFQDGGRPNHALAPGGIIHIDGSNDGSQFRWDHSKWGDMNGVAVADTVIGVFDHLDITINGKMNFFLYIYGNHWNGDTGGNGDKSWTMPANYGSSQFLFIEDCTTTKVRPGGITFLTSAFAGARFVVRYNRLNADDTVNNHGTESRRRSGRAMEIYNNTFAGNDRGRQIGGIRGGGVLIHDNTITGYQGAIAVFSLNCYRELSTSVQTFGGADGTNVWDANYAAPPNNGPFTVSAVSRFTVTVSGSPNWQNNQWRHYTILRDAGRFGFGLITGNTQNQISWAGGFQRNMTINVGDTFHITRVNHALDQPGVGAGSLISGSNPKPPPGWNNQVTEPCYAWNNTSNGAAINLFAPDNQYSIRENEHYFNSAMPSYTPYVYPHPLTKGLLPEQMTQNAKANSQHNLRKQRRPWGGKKLDKKKQNKTKESPTNVMADGQENVDN